MMDSIRQRGLLWWTVIFMATMPAAALAQQSDGGLAVQVRSAETGRPLANVDVVIVDRDGSELRGVSGDPGDVSFVQLAPGLYDLTASSDGRVTVEEPSIRISPRKTTPLTLELVASDGPVDEIVVVARGRIADPFGPVSNSFFNREELRSAVGAGSDVMRALDGLPGLISTGDFANFSVRGRGPPSSAR